MESSHVKVVHIDSTVGAVWTVVAHPSLLPFIAVPFIAVPMIYLYVLLYLLLLSQASREAS